jgi:hypothetical protein
VGRDSGTDNAIGGWLRRLVRPQKRETHNKYGKSAAVFSQISTNKLNALKSKVDNLHKSNHQNLSPATMLKPKWTLVA